MQKIQTKIKAQEWSQHYSLIFHALKCSWLGVVGDEILPKFKLIQAFMVVHVISQNKKIHPKIKALEWQVTSFLPW